MQKNKKRIQKGAFKFARLFLKAFAVSFFIFELFCCQKKKISDAFNFKTNLNALLSFLNAKMVFWNSYKIDSMHWTKMLSNSKVKVFLEASARSPTFHIFQTRHDAQIGVNLVQTSLKTWFDTEFWCILIRFMLLLHKWSCFKFVVESDDMSCQQMLWKCWFEIIYLTLVAIQCKFLALAWLSSVFVDTVLIIVLQLLNSADILH